MNKKRQIRPIIVAFFTLTVYPTNKDEIYETPSCQALHDAKQHFKIFKEGNLTKYIHSKGKIQKSKNPKWCREQRNFKTLKTIYSPKKRKQIIGKRHKRIRNGKKNNKFYRKKQSHTKR